MVVNDSVFKETIELIRSSPRPATTTWTGEFVIGETTFAPIQIMSVNRKCSYEDSISDDISIVVKMHHADYHNLLYPGRDIARFILRKAIADNEEGDSVDGEYIYESSWKVILSDQQNPALQGGQDIPTSGSMIDVTFQCIDDVISELLYTRVGGIYHGTDPLSVLKVMVGESSMALDVPDEVSVKGIDAVEYEVPKEERVRQHVIIPHGQPLLNLHEYLQRNAGGIYNQGISMYLFNRLWYVFPPYRTDRYTSVENTLDILVVPPQQDIGVDRTYCIKEGKLFVSVSDMSQQDLKEQSYLTVGNGIRFLKATETFNDFVTVSKNKATTNPSKTVMSYLIDERKEKLSNVPFSKTRVTDNTAFQSTQLSKRKGQFVQVTWDNADAMLLYPGMPVQLRYIEREQENLLRGTLLASFSSTGLASGGLMDKRYRTTVKMILFVNEPQEG